MSDNVYQYSAKTMSGKDISLEDYKGNVLLIVNTASKCGFTPQFEGLETMFQEYKEKGLTILGFPCNQFGHQDPGTNGEISEFCQLNYGVSFQMFEKIDVNGDDTHPLYGFLKKEAKGLAGTESIKWNFTKFLVDRDGNVIKRYAPKDTPSKIAKDIEALL